MDSGVVEEVEPSIKLLVTVVKHGQPTQIEKPIWIHPGSMLYRVFAPEFRVTQATLIQEDGTAVQYTKEDE